MTKPWFSFGEWPFSWNMCRGSRFPGFRWPWLISSFCPPSRDCFRDGHMTQSGSMNFSIRRFSVAVWKIRFLQVLVGCEPWPSRGGGLPTWEESRWGNEEKQVAANIVWMADACGISSPRLSTHQPLESFTYTSLWGFCLLSQRESPTLPSMTSLQLLFHFCSSWPQVDSVISPSHCLALFFLYVCTCLSHNIAKHLIAGTAVAKNMGARILVVPFPRVIAMIK